MSTAPTVSIVLPTYNGSAYLAQSIDSCLQQSYRDFELIVVDDGSTDETPALLARYDDPRIVKVRIDNGGLPNALNVGFERARGRYWSWTSDDNVYLPRAIETMVAFLDAHPQSPSVCANCYIIDENGATVGYDHSICACFLYRADAARTAGRYRPEFRLVEDVDFFLRLAHVAGPMQRIAEPHYKYRSHDKSLSHRQLSRRQVASLKMHHDLITRGIEKGDLEELFVDRLARTMIHRDLNALEEILAFARAQQVPFLSSLERQALLLRTPPGWLLNRMRFVVSSRVDRLKKRIRLLRR